jgi:CheY-like chemotaxis protein
MNRVPLILVADDEPIVAHTLVQILESEGYRAISVSNGKAAVEWAHRASPDLVICDVIMPGLNGIEAAKAIRQILPQVPVILFSGQAAAGSMIERAAGEGYAFEVLAKPIKPDLLLEVIRKSVNVGSAAGLT